jgi:uncharacterized protein (UPF0210 family)
VERSFEAEIKEKRKQLQTTKSTHYLGFKFIMVFKRSVEAEVERQDNMVIQAITSKGTQRTRNYLQRNYQSTTEGRY